MRHDELMKRIKEQGQRRRSTGEQHDDGNIEYLSEYWTIPSCEESGDDTVEHRQQADDTSEKDDNVPNMTAEEFARQQRLAEIRFEKMLLEHKLEG